ncbi:hypothetical protein PR048_027153 [Dryococelus australis]|uniref:Uncharacterized protein n=1 Tax=Dryococelus australis TaxID=614101 RepID=A0ABQ9GG67_9NEOP|nr:hypothetical protein PR048_027153 [Dryococelus australis]
MKGRGGGIPEKTRRPATSSGTITTSEDSGSILPGSNPVRLDGRRALGTDIVSVWLPHVVLRLAKDCIVTGRPAGAYDGLSFRNAMRWDNDNVNLRDLRHSGFLSLGKVRDNAVLGMVGDAANHRSAQAAAYDVNSQSCNEGAGETGDPRENPPTSGFVLHDSHLRKSRVNRPGIEPGSPWWEASSLTTQPPGQVAVCQGALGVASRRVPCRTLPRSRGGDATRPRPCWSSRATYDPETSRRHCSRSAPNPPPPGTCDTRRRLIAHEPVLYRAQSPDPANTALLYLDLAIFRKEKILVPTGDTATRIKCVIAAKRKALNWRVVSSSHCMYVALYVTVGLPAWPAVIWARFSKVSGVAVSPVKGERGHPSPQD